MRAAANGHSEAVKVLLKHGVHTHIRNGVRWHSTAFHISMLQIIDIPFKQLKLVNMYPFATA